MPRKCVGMSHSSDYQAGLPSRPVSRPSSKTDPFSLEANDQQYVLSLRSSHAVTKHCDPSLLFAFRCCCFFLSFYICIFLVTFLLCFFVCLFNCRRRSSSSSEARAGFHRWLWLLLLIVVVAAAGATIGAYVYVNTKDDNESAAQTTRSFVLSSQIASEKAVVRSRLTNL